MTLKILCEGPDDVAALRELGIFLFGATSMRSEPCAGPAGESRQQRLTVGRILIEITAAPGGKSGLPDLLVLALGTLPPKDRSDDLRVVRRITIVFDPDGEPPGVMCKRLADEVAAKASDWTLEGTAGCWTARRAKDDSIVGVWAVPWRSPGGVIDGLPDSQNLERLLCFVAAAAYPTEAKLVERWLGEMSSAGKMPTWKAAKHFWCALVEPKASEANAAARFLHQNEACSLHVQGTLEQVSLYNDLSKAMGYSET